MKHYASILQAMIIPQLANILYILTPQVHLMQQMDLMHYFLILQAPKIQQSDMMLYFIKRQIMAARHWVMVH
ncbi:hypothetical protein [Paucihalobacter sp.]|uniref:hypothetical protein n=1 Tax=Paucihalobacter sp. TaxID=2850405 RepID=UPI002FE03F76